jgi:hypothetical protein
MRFNPSLRGFCKKPACAEFISVWQSVEHIAKQARKDGISAAIPNALIYALRLPQDD